MIGVSCRSIFLGIFLFIGCDFEKKSFIHDVDREFTIQGLETKDLISEKLNLGTVLSPVNIFFKNSMLFVSSVGTQFNLSVYDCEIRCKKVGDLILNGGGPNEMLSVAQIMFVNDTVFWVHDVVSNQLKEYLIKRKDDSIYTETMRSIGLQKHSLRITLINNTFVTTTQEIKPLDRFYLYNLSGDLIKTSGKYPDYGNGTEIPPTAIVEVFSGRLTTSSSGHRLAIAYEFMDLVEIFDSHLDLVKRIQGPHQFIPEFDLSERGGHLFMRRIYGKTRMAYSGAASSDKEIFLLYANGRTRKSSDGEAGIYHIHIVSLDWNGNPIAMYELDHPVTSIAVDFEKRIIYGLDRIESEVYTFKF